MDFSGVLYRFSRIRDSPSLFHFRVPAGAARGDPTATEGYKQKAPPCFLQLSSPPIPGNSKEFLRIL